MTASHACQVRATKSALRILHNTLATRTTNATSIFMTSLKLTVQASRDLCSPLDAGALFYDLPWALATQNPATVVWVSPLMGTCD